MTTNDVVTIGSNCIIDNDGRFFLLAEIEAKVPGVEIDPIVIIRITADQADKLIEGGLQLCTIQDEPPVAPPGFEVEFKCIFQDNCKAFSIFDVENSTDEAVLVRISLEEACQQIANGARRCTKIRRPFL
ncbi:hypothetical protein KHA94_09190 [Bacillus sp. FJAT-49705]|uniref:Uncharacterized protein n=1 Tax=Cytobacillus citreus TaxID=2833586 RepID=A0ABS5NRD0_9BACI|nr:hypothetical protein [Cytobacillus citreus]MBS4190375.1 hypothetical protein [Cytobacillus citreus]